MYATNKNKPEGTAKIQHSQQIHPAVIVIVLIRDVVEAMSDRARNTRG